MTPRELRDYRDKRFREVTTKIGVYALCDLDKSVIYVGQTTSIKERGISGRSRRHVTSARSDTVASRKLDVWEVAYVWAWPTEVAKIDELEANLTHYFDAISPLPGAKSLARPASFATFKPAPPQETQLLPDDEIERRKDPQSRLARQILQISQVLDWILNVKDTADMRRALRVHFARAARHYDSFMTQQNPEAGGTSAADD